jgi:hypothetical protein
MASMAATLVASSSAVVAMCFKEKRARKRMGRGESSEQSDFFKLRTVESADFEISGVSAEGDILDISFGKFVMVAVCLQSVQNKFFAGSSLSYLR